MSSRLDRFRLLQRTGLTTSCQVAAFQVPAGVCFTSPPKPTRTLGRASSVPLAVCTAREYDSSVAVHRSLLLAVRRAFIGSHHFEHSWLPSLEASNFESFSSLWLRSFPSSLINLYCVASSAKRSSFPLDRAASAQLSVAATCLCKYICTFSLILQPSFISPYQLFQELLPHSLCLCPVRVANPLCTQLTVRVAESTVLQP
jgi:hypothetical protein